jgi:hypothetical protein
MKTTMSDKEFVNSKTGHAGVSVGQAQAQTMVLAKTLAQAVVIAASGFAMAPLASAQSDAGSSVQEAADACLEAARLGEAGDIEGALEEARWCLEVFEQIRQDAAFAALPDELDGWSAGELDNQSAMGMTILSRRYTKDDRAIDLSITTGVAGSGLAALAQLGATLGAGQGDKFRIQRRTVTDMSDAAGESVNFLVELRSGGMMTVESSDSSKADVRSFLEAMPIAEIDEAMEG